MNPEKIALSGFTSTLSTLRDGTVRLKIDFQPADRVAAMQLFGEPFTQVGITVLNDDFKISHELEEDPIAIGGTC